MKRIKREDEEGAMGVGTLIIFIAMVLVAAVAASVLIDTANQLQQQAQRTGDEAIQEVSSSFQVQDVYGVNYSGAFSHAEDGQIEEINMKIGLAAGANPQDLKQTIVQIQSDEKEVNLQASDWETWSDGSGANATATEYGWEPIIKQESDADDSSFVESGDLYKLTLNLTAEDGGEDIIGTLGTQASLDINIIPKHGTPTYEELVTPSTITTKMVSL